MHQTGRLDQPHTLCKQPLSIVSILDVGKTEPNDLVDLAIELGTTYQKGANSAKGVPQIQQLQQELDVRLQLIQIKQNAEIIRLLKKQAGEK